MNEVFCKFKTCPIVEGYTRDIICDLQRNNFEFIPKSLTSFIRYCEGKSKKKIKEYVEYSENKTTYKEYLKFLKQNEFVFFCDEDDYNNFTDFGPEKYEIPYTLKTLIIQYNSKLNYIPIVAAANKCLVPSISFDLTECNNADQGITRISLLLTNTRFYTIFFKINEVQIFLCEYLQSFASTCSFNIVIYLPYSLLRKSLDINYSHLQFRYYSITGLNPGNDFIVNHDFYFESLSANQFYNKKIFVNQDGYISPMGYKHYFIKSIEKVENEEYNQIFSADHIVWSISKFKIKNCKHCEFKLICCTDNLPLLKNGEWVLENECNYNPYTNEWSNL